MPIASRFVIVAAFFCAGIILGCGGDDDGGSNGSPTRTATSSPSRTATDGAGSPTGDEKSPGPDETGGAQPTSGDGGPGPTRAPFGTPAVEPPDTTAYLEQFRGKNIVQETCVYDPTTLVVDCPNRGQFAIDPPITGQDISCTIGIVEGTAQYINCRSEEPRVARYYQIQ